MLKHRKKEHLELVPICREVKQGNICQYADSCWYSHDTSEQMKQPLMYKNIVNPKLHTGNTTQTTQPTNFWQVPKTISPGDPMEEMRNMMQRMLTDISQLMKNQQTNQQ